MQNNEKTLRHLNILFAAVVFAPVPAWWRMFTVVWVAAGMSREEAVYCARRQFGNVTLIEEQSREVWSWRWIENRFADLSFAFRQMRREPLFALVSCLSLALGIGATAIMFSVVYSVLINPYPYKDADRMMHIHILDKDAFLTDLLLSSSQFRRFQDSRVLDGAIANFRSPSWPDIYLAMHSNSSVFHH